MANRKATLIRYAHLPDLGWRRGQLVTSRNGKIKPDYMMVNGVAVHAPNGVYQIRYYNGRKPVCKSVGNDLDEALTALDKYLKKMDYQNLMADLGIETPVEQKKTIAEYHKTYLEKYAVGGVDKVALYTVVGRDFTNLLAEAGKTMPKQIEEADVIRLDRQWEAAGYSKSTRSGRYTTVRCFLRHMDIDPNKLIDKPTNQKLKSKPQTLPEVYTEEQIDKLIAASSERHGLIWESFYKLGFRDEELATLEWENIDFVNNTAEIKFKPHVQVPGAKEQGWRPKDKEERSLPISEGLAKKLKAWREKNPKTQFVFGTKSDRPDIKLLKALKSDWRRAGLNCGRCDGCTRTATKRVNGKLVTYKPNACGAAYLHRFRSSFLTRMLSHTNSRNVQKLAGHSSLVTTERYLRPAAMDGLQAAVNAAFD